MTDMTDHEIKALAEKQLEWAVALRRRLHRWQGAACLVLYFLYLAAVSFAPRAGA